jgi:hypothetical protein
MSDGGISFTMAMGWSSQELACPIYAHPEFVHRLDADWQKLGDSVRRALRGRNHWISREPQKPLPELSGDLAGLCRRVLAGEDMAGGWTWDRDDAVNAINEWNAAVDHAWRIGLGLGDELVAKARPSNKKLRAKIGYTKRVTPRMWGSGYNEKLKPGLRDKFIKFNIPPHIYTHEIWAAEITGLMEFLTEGKLPEGVVMDRNKPKLNHKQAGNLVWYLQEAMGIIDNDEIDICSECGTVVMTDRETHDWCSKCGKMRCESCTTAPSHCTCDYPCGKHCKCKAEE